MLGVTQIRGVYDFKQLLREVRPRTADRDIQSQFGLQFRASGDGTKIHVRSKNACSLRVPFGPWQQMLPHPGRPEAIPDRSEAPPECDLKEWPEFLERIVPTLSQFYKETFRHPVHIPVADRDEMMDFLTQGPGTCPTPPEWIEWGDPIVPAAEPAPEPATEPAVAAANARRRVWRPFLRPRGTRRNMMARPLPRETRRQAMRRARAEAARRIQDGYKSTSSSEDGAEAAANEDGVEAAGNEDAKAPESYPVGTWVAFQFGDKTFAGTITKFHESENLYHVKFTDGDHADYDGDEIHYAIQLYERDFNS